MFLIPPGKAFLPRDEKLPEKRVQWEIAAAANGTLLSLDTKDLQKTKGAFASCTFVIPPERKFTPRDLTSVQPYQTQWELPEPGLVMFQKDIGLARTQGKVSQFDFEPASVALSVTSSRKNVELPSPHVGLRAYVESPRGALAGAPEPTLHPPPLPQPGTSRSAPLEAHALGAAPTIPSTMAEVIMLRDGRGGAPKAALGQGLSNAVVSARALEKSGGAMPQWERRARMALIGSVLAPAGGSQRQTVASAVGHVRSAEATLRRHRLTSVDTSKYDAALRDAREGSLMATLGGTPAALRRSLCARREALGV
jgi:hypothetical protein